MKTSCRTSRCLPAPAGSGLLVCFTARRATGEKLGQGGALESRRRPPGPGRIAVLEVGESLLARAMERLDRRGTANPSGG